MMKVKTLPKNLKPVYLMSPSENIEPVIIVPPLIIVIIVIIVIIYNLNHFFWFKI